MRKLLALLSLLCLPAFGSDSYIKISVIATTLPATGNAANINGNNRIFTNATAALTIATNTTIPSSLTNYFNALSTYQERSVITLWAGTTNLTIEGTNLSFTIGGAWCYVSSGTTQALGNHWAFMGPFDSFAATNRTNWASEIIYASSLYSTQAFATNANALSNYVTLGRAAQTFGNKTLTNSTETGGWITNAIAIGGTVTRLTNGYYTNAILDRAIGSNFVNYGNAISSPGTGTSAEQFGTGAAAIVEKATAVGNGAAVSANGTNGTAFGYVAVVTGRNGTALGEGTEASGGQNGLAAGAGAAVTVDNGTAIGTGAVVSHTNSTSIGQGVASTTTNQVRLGKSGDTVAVSGTLLVEGSISNSIVSGTNIWKGDISHPQYDLAVANGVNLAVIIGTNENINAYGPTAAYEIDGFQNWRDGKEFTLLKTNSFTLTIGNDTGDPTLPNRILTGTGASITTTQNPANIKFKYMGTLQKWSIVSRPAN